MQQELLIFFISFSFLEEQLLLPLTTAMARFILLATTSTHHHPFLMELSHSTSDLMISWDEIWFLEGRNIMSHRGYGIKFLQENGMTDRDLKPSNNKIGQLKMCYFGFKEGRIVQSHIINSALLLEGFRSPCIIPFSWRNLTPSSNCALSSTSLHGDSMLVFWRPSIFSGGFAAAPFVMIRPRYPSLSCSQFQCIYEAEGDEILSCLLGDIDDYCHWFHGAFC